MIAIISNNMQVMGSGSFGEKYGMLNAMKAKCEEG